MGGGHSKHKQRCGSPRAATRAGPPLPAFVVIDWDAAFLGRRMADGDDQTSSSNTGALHASSPALAQAFHPLVDARRLVALAEGGILTPTPPPPPPTSSLAPPSPPPLNLNVRGRLVLFPADLSVVVNHRLFRLFHRRHYRPIVGPRELQAPAAARALGRFTRRLTRHRHHHRGSSSHSHGQGHGRPPVGVVVVVAGDGGLERSPAYAGALRTALQQGFVLEVWAWEGGGHTPPLYGQLAAEFTTNLVRVRGLDAHRARLRYGGAGPTGRGGLDGLLASTMHSVAAAVAAAAMPTPSAPPSAPPSSESKPSQPPVVPVAVPLAVGVGEGDVQQGYLLPSGKILGAVESSDEEEDEEGEKGAEQAGASAAAAAAAGAALAAAASGGQQRQQRQQQDGQEEEEEDEEEPPAFLLDPLTFEPLEDPVLAPSGYTFSRAVILDQIRRRGTDPFTGAPLAEGDLRPNRALAEAVETWRAAQQRGKGGKGGGGSGSA